jgi:hypothetical protein
MCRGAHDRSDPPQSNKYFSMITKNQGITIKDLLFFMMFA